jgi:hypothetical protein
MVLVLLPGGFVAQSLQILRICASFPPRHQAKFHHHLATLIYFRLLTVRNIAALRTAPAPEGFPLEPLKLKIGREQAKFCDARIGGAEAPPR